MWNRLPLPTVQAVRFEIVGDTLDPGAVTAALGLEPDWATPPGPCPPEITEMLEGLFGGHTEGVVPHDPAPSGEDAGSGEFVLPGSWELSTQDHVAPGWLEPHLRYLLARLTPRERALRVLAADARLRLSVGFVTTAPDGAMPSFEAVRAAPSPWAAAALARLGISIDSMSMSSPPSGDTWDDPSPDEPWQDG